MLQDLRYAVRALRRSSGFAVTAIVTLALSVALGTSLFATVDAIFFRTLPVHAPEELVYLYWTPGQGSSRPFPLPRTHFEHLRDTPEAFSAVAGHLMWSGRVDLGGAAETLHGELVTANYFGVLGVQPMLGRAFLPEEDARGSAGSDLVVLIGHDLWTRRFAASPDVLGKTMTVTHQDLGTRDATIVGVLPRGFVGLNNPWTPSECWFTFAQATGARYPRISVAPIARRRADVSLDQARAIVTTKARRLHHDPQQKDIHIVLPASRVSMPFDPDSAVLPARLTVSMVLVVAIVLLVTTTNVMGLMNARGLGRLQDVFVRRALGASTARLAGQLALEGIVLAVAAGLVGLLAASWLVALFQHYMPERFAIRVAVGPRTWLFAAILCGTLAIVVSLGPILQGLSTRAMDPSRAFRLMTERISHRLLRHALVLVQVTMAALLALVAATHLMSLLTLERRHLGYEPRNLVSVGVRLPLPTAAPGMTSQDEAREAERARTFVRSLLLRNGSLPGVQAMALSNGFPLQVADGNTFYLAVSSEDFVPGVSTGPGVDTVAVSPGYFQTLGMRFLRGRDFDERDTRERPSVAIVSQALAAQLWPGRDPIDRTLAVIAPTTTPKVEWLQVVGVVNEVTPLFLEHRSAPFVYLPMSQQWAPSVSHVLARVDGNAAEASQDLKQAILGADPRADVYRIQAATQMLGDLLYSRRLATAVLGGGAVIAMVLALVGLYAVVSYSVSRRVHELGVRAVLGADRATLVWFVIREALIVAAVGCVLGLALAHAAVGTTASLFEGMPRLDGLTASAMLLMLGALVGIAAYVPARHAARIDPTEALRAL